MTTLVSELTAPVAAPDSEILCRAIMVRLLIGVRREVLGGATTPARPDEDQRLIAEVDSVLRSSLHRAPSRADVAQAVGLLSALGAAIPQPRAERSTTDWLSCKLTKLPTSCATVPIDQSDCQRGWLPFKQPLWQGVPSHAPYDAQRVARRAYQRLTNPHSSLFIVHC